jgi:hypothetical protein
VSRYGKTLPKQDRGRPIKAADLRAVAKAAEGLARQQLGGVLAQTSIAGVPLSLAGGTSGLILLGKAPGGGIAAHATGTVTLYEYGSHTTLSAATLEVTNPWPDACPGNHVVTIATVNGVPNSALTWSCLSA